LIFCIIIIIKVQLASQKLLPFKVEDLASDIFFGQYYISTKQSSYIEVKVLKFNEVQCKTV